MGAIVVFIAFLIVGYMLAMATATTQTPDIARITFITTLFIGLVCILGFRVFIMNSKQAFKLTLLSGSVFSTFLLVLELFCYITIQIS
ncbi:hypothetical protein G9U52_27920 [Paenibacillus sp. S3N08]|uniref:Uncharacterized protein n=2 Tax=Paenibacillus agricola TaxID=2716264 RepID=A0ABX0JB03_9BACL|nr:hypothetical protein [Paenibacillus agricola]